MTWSRPVTEIIKQRFSCRTYQDRPLAGETQQQLVRFLRSTPSGPFGTGARFELVAATEQDRQALRGLGTYGLIRGATAFVIGATRDAEKNLEDFGYLLERIILFATDLDLGTCWLGGTFTRSSFAQKISARDEESVPAVTPVGYISEKRGAVDSLIRRGAGSDRRLPWERLVFEARSGTPLTPEAAGLYALPLEMVRLAPSASNRQPWRIIREGHTWHFYLRRTPGYREGSLSRFSGIADMQRIDMGIAMCHFELTASELGLEGEWELKEPRLEEPGALGEYTVSWVSA